MAFGSADAIGGDFAPTFDLKVNNTPVSAGVRALINSVEYEHVDGMADVLKIVASDPLDTAGVRMLSDSKLFAVGNEITVAYGYFGGVIENVGRAMIRKLRPVYPQTGVPTLEIIGYTRDVLMMDNAPIPLKERKTKKKRGKTVETDELKDSKAGRRFVNQRYSDAVIARAEDYNFIPDVDVTPDTPHDFIHKAGMTDYDFVKGISNITGFYFWVDYDFDQVGWVLHLKNPETYIEPQEKEFNFKYAQGEYSTLLTFEPELAIQDSTTTLYVEVVDPLSGRNLEVKIEDPSEAAPDPSDPASPDLIDHSGDGSEKLEHDYGWAGGVKLYLGDFSFEIKTNRRFRDENELQFWATQWFRRQRENFILSSGRTIGVEALRCRQIHRFSGVGVAFEGRYVFNKLRHIFTSGGGYECEFNARKFVEPMPTLPAVTATTLGAPSTESEVILFESNINNRNQ